MKYGPRGYGSVSSNGVKTGIEASYDIGNRDGKDKRYL